MGSVVLHSLSLLIRRFRALHGYFYHSLPYSGIQKGPPKSPQDESIRELSSWPSKHSSLFLDPLS